MDVISPSDMDVVSPPVPTPDGTASGTLTA